MHFIFSIISIRIIPVVLLFGCCFLPLVLSTTVSTDMDQLITTKPKVGANFTTTSVEDQFGGGAINEKERKGPLTTNNFVGGAGDCEKTSGFDGHNLSHRLHALMGLDRYPNYLLRWNNIQDIHELESTLEQQLDLVKKQKSLLLERNNVISKHVDDLTNGEMFELSDLIKRPPGSWKELMIFFHPSASKALFDKKFFNRYSDLTVEEVLSEKCRDISLDPSLLEEWMDMEIFDVYSFPIFSNVVCLV